LVKEYYQAGSICIGWWAI